MKKPIICIDRDGTLIHDTKEHLFLGREDDWREKVRILPGAVEGIRLLNTNAKAGIYMITNQAGVAISDFPLLTEDRAHEVCSYVLGLLENEGAKLDGYFLCPHATFEYAKRKPHVNFYRHLVHDCQCLKPSLGMVFKALQAEKVTPDNADVYVIGDRASDVKTALNLNGTGILVPFVNEHGEIDKVRLLKQKDQIFVAENMMTAAQFILAQVGLARSCCKIDSP